MLGVLGWGRGEMGRKFGTQNFVEMNVENLNKYFLKMKNIDLHKKTKSEVSRTAILFKEQL